MTISPAATASDVDNTDLIYGEVRIVAGGFDGDILTVNGLQSGTFLGIDFSYDAGLRRLLFNNPAPVADYQALMQAVGFWVDQREPDELRRHPVNTVPGAQTVAEELHPADRRRLGGGRRQQRAHHHAVGR